MQAYFTASIAGKKEYLSNYEAIIDFLKRKGCDVKAEHIIHADEAKISLETRDDRLKFHRMLEEWINACDFMVVESSYPSISVGYEMALAIRRGKPLLILYHEGSTPPSLLGNSEEDKIVCEKYAKDTLEQIIDDFLGYVRGANDTRFTFFITSQIAAYLDKVSQKTKVPKSVYLRHLIQEDMRKQGA